MEAMNDKYTPACVALGVETTAEGLVAAAAAAMSGAGQ